MSDAGSVDRRKRRFLIGATTAVGAVGAAAVAVPFAMSMWPSERAKAAGAPVEADIGKLEPGQKINVEWRGKVVWIINRTPAMLASLPKLDDKLADPNSNVDHQPPYAKNEDRSTQARDIRRRRHLHAPGLLADVPARRRAGGPRSRVAGRLFLSLSPVEIRSGRPRVQGRPCADQSGHSAIQVPVGHQNPDR